MGNIVRWHGYAPKKEDGRVMRRALKFQAEGQKREVETYMEEAVGE